MKRLPTVRVAAGVIRDDATGRLLLTRRAENAHLGGLWEFPGGKIETGESPEDAVLRELEEELSVRVRVGAALLEITHEYPDRTVHLKFFECRIVAGQPRAHNEGAMAWCKPEELVRYPMPEANTRLVRMLSGRTQPGGSENP